MSVELITMEDNEFLLSLPQDEYKVTCKDALNDVLKRIQDTIPNHEQAYNFLTSIYAKARDWKKAIETKRKELTEPFRKEVIRINDKAKEVSDPIDRIIDLANLGASNYMKFLEDKKKQEEEKAQIAYDLFDLKEFAVVAEVPKSIRGEGAMTVTKTENKFRVTDMNKIPEKYLQVNEALVLRDIKLGITEIEGLEIYQETTTQLRKR